MDIVSKTIDYENGELTEEETIEFFQELVNTGMAWKLQDSYGRTAAKMIEEGYVNPADFHVH